MDAFNLQQYLDALHASQSINDCPKVPRPVIGKDQNFIFISYSHTDYKSVYTALAHMYDAGVRFWYDGGLTAGRDWETEAKEMIQHPCCCGAIFFLSRNLFLSNSVIKIELPCILAVSEKGIPVANQSALNYFCVNICNEQPSEIIFDIMPELRKRGQGTTWLRLLSTAFPDEMTYVSTAAVEYPKVLIEQIRHNFNVLESPDATADVSQWIASHKALDISGQWYLGLIDPENLLLRIGTVWIEQTFLPNQYQELKLAAQLCSVDYYDSQRNDFRTEVHRAYDFMGDCTLDETGEASGIVYFRRIVEGSMDPNRVIKGTRRCIFDFAIDLTAPDAQTTYIQGKMDEMQYRPSSSVHLFRNPDQRNAFLLQKMKDAIDIK